MIEKLIYEYYQSEDRKELTGLPENYQKIINALKDNPEKKLETFFKELDAVSLGCLMRIINKFDREQLNLNPPEIDHELQKFLTVLDELNGADDEK